jgi:predicted O-linked N-acetylglucosamine transferase (SPINDLY family)
VLFHASQLTRQHSVYKDRHQVIKNLSLDPRFDVYFSTFDDLGQEVKYTFGNATHIKLPKNLSEIRDTLTKMKLDIMIYCEIGMDNTSYFMAHMKLARYQGNTWGHSDTSGIDTIDYYFSSKLYELDYEEAQTHYTEKLILQNSLCTSYINPASRHNIKLFKDRNHFGFTDECVIYFCAQSLFKFNPLFDEYITNILTNVPNSVIVMLNNDNKNKFIKRFNNKNITNKMHFFPPMQHFDFLNLMNISDIILDIFPFGGCNSSMEAFSLNKVIVTQPSIMINGRFTRGFYLKMGLGEYICNTKEEYIDFAIKLGCNSELRKEIGTKISENKHVLFLDKDTIEEWTNDLIKINNNLD